jgi:hypothetical protein
MFPFRKQESQVRSTGMSRGEIASMAYCFGLLLSPRVVPA